MHEYTWYQWLMFFYCYCFFGWIFESAYVSVKKRHFVNRGFLRLPMLPLYGTGAVMMLIVSIPVKGNLVLVYLAGVMGATALEYVTGWGMEKLFKMRYWDYSNQRFQIKGYICLSSSIAWGFLTIFLTEFIHRPIERMVLGMNVTFELVLTAVISALFVADTIESTRAALDLGRALEAMTRMKAEIEEMQVQLALLKSELKEQTAERVAAAQEETALRMAELRAEADARMNGRKESGTAKTAGQTAARVAELKAEVSERLEVWKDRSAEQLEALKDRSAERMEVLTEKIAALHRQRKGLRENLPACRRLYLRGILRGNPGAVSEKYREALKELQEELLNERKKSRR